ncbi:MAG: PstS family phosphate ABC transporter substrate-binding protein, partial [Phycisphaerales bacterium]|nr:PstS family phosphate ABC transporter substrate-binding protein [Phycisphaerales bacterium]
QDPAPLRGAIRIDGSSTVYPITEAVAEEFSKQAAKVNVSVGISGTGGGFKRFCVGETDITDASRPITPSEVALAAEKKVEYIEIPVAYDALTIVVNPKNDWVKSLTVDQVRKIYSAADTAKSWKDIDSNWPDRPMKVFSPGTDSGTFDYFKEAVIGKDGNVRSDMSVSEDDNALVMGVAGNIDGIGYFGLAYFEENQSKLRAIPIDGGKGPVAPSVKTVNDGTYTPLSRPLFIYVNRKSADRSEVQAFIDFYLKEAGELAKEVGYVNMPDEILARAKGRWASRKTGTVFVADGKKVEGAFSALYR